MDVQECNLVIIRKLPEGEEAGQYSSRNKDTSAFSCRWNWLHYHVEEF
jgi:hypothetical protein